MPVSGRLQVGENERGARFSHENEVARPYLYSVAFDNGLKAAVAPTERGAMMRFEYPAKAKRYLVIDAFPGGSMVKIIPEEHKIIGYCRKSNHSTPAGFTNYFVITIGSDFKSCGTWENSGGITLSEAAGAEGSQVGAYVELEEGGPVSLKVASSFISHAQAERNLMRELGEAASLEEVSGMAANAWEQELGKVMVEGGSEEETATFYSCLFRSMLFPRKFYEYDAGGRPVYYSPYDGRIHEGIMFTDTGFWDTFRSQFPLNAILHPEMHDRYIGTLADAYDQSGSVALLVLPRPQRRHDRQPRLLPACRCMGEGIP